MTVATVATVEAAVLDELVGPESCRCSGPDGVLRLRRGSLEEVGR
jgi:hypothetical protein